MKQMSCSKTSQVVTALTVFMMLPVLMWGQVFDTTPPKISHQPVKLGRTGRALPIIAYISDTSGIKAATMHLQHDGQITESEMTLMTGGESIPVTVQMNESATAYSGPGEKYKVMGTIPAGAQLEVTLVRPPYYRIRTANGMVGYIPSASADIVESGQAFRTTIPAELTSAAKCSYQISALDDFGNESRTGITQIRFITEEELARMQQDMSGGPAKVERPSDSSAGTSDNLDVSPQSTRPGKGPSKPIYKKPVFWIVTAAVGGGAYYLLSGDDDPAAKKATVDMIVSW